MSRRMTSGGFFVLDPVFVGRRNKSDDDESMIGPSPLIDSNRESSSHPHFPASPDSMVNP
jgi:hypothetical protein